MSKKETKAVKTKKKQTGFDIMYRVVTAVMAVAVFPVAYFLNLIYYALDWTKIMAIINNLQGALESGNLLEAIGNLISSGSATADTLEISDGYICLANLGEFKDLLSMAGDGEVNLGDMLLHNSALRPLLISLVLFAAVLVLALVILIISAVANKPKAVAVISGVGAALGIASNVAFSVFANPLINGKTSLKDIIGSGSFVISLVGDVIELHYDNAFFIVLALMVAICIWSLSVILVNSDDKAEKALKEAKRAEKKAKKAKKAAKKAEKTAKKAADALKDEQKKAEAEEKSE